jgi:hypothetical protein
VLEHVEAMYEAIKIKGGIQAVQLYAMTEVLETYGRLVPLSPW